MKLTIFITEDDIKQGKKRECLECPIALAVKRATDLEFGENKLIPHIAPNFGMLISDEISYRFQLPGEAERFLHEFDHSIRTPRVKPFSVNIYLSEVENR